MILLGAEALRKVRPKLRASRLTMVNPVDSIHPSLPWPWRNNSIVMIKTARIRSASDIPRWKRPMAELNHGSRETEISRPVSESVQWDLIAQPLQVWAGAR